MADPNFILDDTAFEESVQGLIIPDQVMPRLEEEEVVAPVLEPNPGPQEERGAPPPDLVPEGERGAPPPDPVPERDRGAPQGERGAPPPNPVSEGERGAPPPDPVPERDRGAPAPDVPEVLTCMMETADDSLHAFQEYEHYVLNSEDECAVPEDDWTDDEDSVERDPDVDD